MFWIALTADFSSLMSDPIIYVVEVDKDNLLDQFKKLVSYEWFEVVYINDFVLFLNENGKLIDSAFPNLKYHANDVIYDDLFIVKDDYDNDSYLSLSEEDLVNIKKLIKERKLFSESTLKNIKPTDFLKIEYINN